MLTKENVDLLITCFINAANLKASNFKINNDFEIGTQGVLDWDAIDLLSCAFEDKSFIGKDDIFVKIGLEENSSEFFNTLKTLETLYLKDEDNKIKIIEKVSLESYKNFDAILYINIETYNYFKKNNIFEIVLKELNRLISKEIEQQMKFLDMFEKYDFKFD
ncbi:hypothetical protein [Clostridium botulinum]|uniref:Uncharacterized protein n=1 Tax=Clostridium botulinum (strain Langeland / NCTC 10281 / Type F) TaxID=441772 RepID=A7GEH8_CLOBL|nr:hypothetical protein [Clostridium botulinum]ABS40962.1 hypothetical protein CLI_1930 [Clostridium botulinum F str. Langeland]ADF99604.1 hypothetical protein CBF_1910 [Clostridium botulinum F str. 230613]KKM42821.1 hypothetical protein VT72_04055 [Clostridium botulinum]MBY6791662.1 hypothetical protein [Clostridium botulinum]MBY6936898.1 hypothetical protein [Clostridium botulinum]